MVFFLPVEWLCGAGHVFEYLLLGTSNERGRIRGCLSDSWKAIIVECVLVVSSGGLGTSERFFFKKSFFTSVIS